MKRPPCLLPNGLLERLLKLIAKPVVLTTCLVFTPTRRPKPFPTPAPLWPLHGKGHDNQVKGPGRCLAFEGRESDQVGRLRDSVEPFNAAVHSIRPCSAPFQLPWCSWIRVLLYGAEVVAPTLHLVWARILRQSASEIVLQNIVVYSQKAFGDESSVRMLHGSVVCIE